MIKRTALARRISTLLKKAGVHTHHPERNRDGVTVRADYNGATVRASFVVPIEHMDELVELIERTIRENGYAVRTNRVDEGLEEGYGHGAFVYVREQGA